MKCILLSHIFLEGKIIKLNLLNHMKKFESID